MKAVRFLDRYFELIFICLALVYISVIMFVQIFCRNVLSYAIPWAEESCRYIFIWAGALGISYAATTGTHLRMDVLPTFVKALEKPLAVFSDLALLAVMLWLVKPGYESCMKIYTSGQLSAAMRMPMVYVYIGLMVAIILTILRIIEKYVKLMIRKKTGNGEVTEG